jgi:hypothetical protein
MPLLLDVELPSSSQKSKFITLPCVYTAAFTAIKGNFDEDDFLLPARLQGVSIYAPLGPRSLRTGARVSTKTQIVADRKSKRELKQKAAEEKKCIATACKGRRESK